MVDALGSPVLTQAGHSQKERQALFNSKTFNSKTFNSRALTPLSR